MEWVWSGLRARWRGVVLAEVLLALATASSLASSWVLGAAVDTWIPTGDLATLYVGAAGYVVAIVGGALLTWVARVRIEREAQGALVAVKERLFAHLLDHDLEVHDAEGSGRLLSRVTGDVDALRMVYTEVLLTAPADVLLAVGMLVVLAFVAPTLGLVTAASLPVFGALLWAFRRASPPKFLASREQAAVITAFVTEHLRALPLLRAYGRLGWARGRVREAGEAKFQADYLAGMTGVWFFNGLFAIRGVLLATLVWVGAVQMQAGTLTIGVLLVALDYARKLLDPIVRLQVHLTTIERARAGVRRVDDLLRREPVVRAPPSPSPWPGFRDSLRLDGVSFRYGAHLALDDVDLALHPGERVALVGPTGGGKSTLVQLLFRFRDPSEGAVTLDGVDLRALDPAEHMRHVGLVSQAVHLLPGTVAENLGCDEARAAELIAAVGLTGRVTATSRVGEGGEALSRGEAQLLCVARAFVHEPPILVLDEATAAMDPVAEARIRTLLDARRDRLVVWVAHRLRTVVDCDRIVVLRAGRVVEDGAHAALVAADGPYAALWRASLAAEGG